MKFVDYVESKTAVFVEFGYSIWMSLVLATGGNLKYVSCFLENSPYLHIFYHIYSVYFYILYSLMSFLPASRGMPNHFWLIHQSNANSLSSSY